jgi:sulfatase modifying factor 1
LRSPRYAIVAALLLAANACLVEIKELVGDGAAGGAGAASPSGGSGGTAGADGACPADMVHAKHDGFPDVSFCIDATEVTRAAYVAFLTAVGSDVSQTEQPPECAFNTALTVSGLGSFCPDFSTASDLPVNCIDWCDAYAYCAHVGKRLCGTITDGGPLAIDDLVTSDEWQFACSGGFQQAYPYGDEGVICNCYIPEEWMDKGMCDYMGQNLNLKAQVMSHPACEGGFPGIFDMQGNASEWTNRCDPGTGDGEESCVLRGGTTFSVGGSSYYRCDNLQQTTKRNEAQINQGIRCCRDAAP